MNKSIDYSILFTLFNKSREISETVEKADSLLKNLSFSFEILLCNDGSTDNTGELLLELEKKHDSVRVLSYADNQGRGYAVKFASHHAYGKYFFYLDSDFFRTSSSKYLIKALNQLVDNAIVIGNRYSLNFPAKRIPKRAIVAAAYRMLIRILLPGLKNISDTEAGFKGFHLSVFKQLIEKSKESSWGFDLEIIWLAHKMGVPIYQNPINWEENYEKYESSVNLFEDSISQALSLFRIFIRNVLY